MAIAHKFPTEHVFNQTIHVYWIEALIHIFAKLPTFFNPFFMYNESTEKGDQKEVFHMYLSKSRLV